MPSRSAALYSGTLIKLCISLDLAQLSFSLIFQGISMITKIIRDSVEMGIGIALIFALTLVGCGGNGNAGSNPPAASTVNTGAPTIGGTTTSAVYGSLQLTGATEAGVSFVPVVATNINSEGIHTYTWSNPAIVQSMRNGVLLQLYTDPETNKFLAISVMLNRPGQSTVGWTTNNATGISLNSDTKTYSLTNVTLLDYASGKVVPLTLNGALIFP